MTQQDKSSRPKASSRRRARRKAMQALYQLQLNDTPLPELDAQFMEEPDMLKADLDYFRRLVRGVSEYRAALDELLAPHMSREVAQADPVELAILRIGAYELRYCLEVPYRVVLNEAVELAKIFGAEEGHKFVNGVLDKLAQQLRSAEIRP